MQTFKGQKIIRAPLIYEGFLLDTELCEPGKRPDELERWLQQDLRRSFDNRLLPIAETIADLWAVLSARMQRQGTLLAAIDGLIAATSLEHDLAMATCKVKDLPG